MVLNTLNCSKEYTNTNLINIINALNIRLHQDLKRVNRNSEKWLGSVIKKAFLPFLLLESSYPDSNTPELSSVF